MKFSCNFELCGAAGLNYSMGLPFLHSPITTKYVFDPKTVLQTMGNTNQVLQSLSWHKTVSSTFKDLDFDGSSFAVPLFQRARENCKKLSKFAKF